MDYEKPGRSLPAVSNALYASRYENQSRRDPVTQSKGKRVYCVVAVICVLLALAITTAVVVYVVLDKSDDSDSVDTEPVSLHLITKENDGKYTAAMADPNSDDFKNAASEHCSKVRATLDGSNCKVLTIEEGSRVVEFLIDVLKRVDETLDHLLKEVTDKLNREHLKVQHAGKALGVCRSTTCKNGGTCVGVRGDAVCDCAEGYEGINCADAIQTGTGTGIATATGTGTGTATATGTGTATATATTTHTGAATATGTGTGTATATGTRTGTATATGTGSGTATATGTHTGAATSTGTGSGTATATGTRTGTATATGAATGTATATVQPSATTTTTATTGTMKPTATGTLQTTVTVTATPTRPRSTTATPTPTGTTTSPTATSCGHSEISCTDGSCAWGKMCDSVQDCPDGSDEEGCTVTSDCGSDLTCANGDCKWGTACDGFADCADGSDEWGCGCHWSEFQCWNGTCLDQELVCDGKDDCWIGRDEIGCDATCKSFNCANGKCIGDYYVCNTHNDCGDWSDETACDCLSEDRFRCQQPPVCRPILNWCSGGVDCPDASDEVEGCHDFCPDGFSWCENYTCVAESAMCDGVKDCPGGGDELDCECNGDDRFLCQNGICLDFSYHCNERDDCGDFSDEWDCEYCSSDEYFMCNGSHSTCVSKRKVCNGVSHCPEGDDEYDGCAEECRPGQFGCPTQNKCYDMSSLCTGYETCPDELDYSDCICDENMFQCANGQCRYAYTWCNGYPDCPDGSDEPENCVGTCAPGQLQCNGSGECVSSSYICNGWSSCEDGEDERGCNCSTSQFECDGFCVNDYEWCDGTVDCPDSGLDELDCNDTCPPSKHRCLNLNGFSCRSLYVVCDGEPNCMDWSDELDPSCPLCENENATRCHDPPACLLPDYWCAGQGVCPDGSDSPDGCECRAYQFDCGSGTTKCLPFKMVCDGTIHCADKRDELQCECSEDQKRCDSGLCLYKDDWCNGIDNCGDFSDELDCECTNGSLPCDDGQSCYVAYQYCNGFPNCRDRSDEPPGCSCRDEQFNCSGVCLPNFFLCDGTVQCPGGSDEKDCECPEFKCNETFECYNEFDRCDGEFDCADRSDELGCEDECKEEWFSCDNGLCIDGEFVCDQYDHCGDNSDEVGCNYTCLDEEFKCSAGNCIPKLWLCDLIADCEDADDEDKAHCANCASGEKPCRGGETCYQPSETCDGVQQCPYGEDEYNCVTLDKETPFVLKATKENVAYDGICSDNWSDAWSSAACTYLGYESAESHAFIEAPNSAPVLVPQSSSPPSAPLLTALAPGNCASGQIVSVKCISKECGIVPVHSNSFSPYIINGQNAEAGQWPWQIQLLNEGNLHCGGSVIDKYWVLTAAHCVTTRSGLETTPSTFVIRAGALTKGLPDPNSRNYGVAKLIVHPDYHRTHLENDIALVQLTHPIEYTDYIQPACIAATDYDINTAVECYISGWGAERLIAYPTHLKQAKMDILDNDYCTQLAKDGNGKRWGMAYWNIRKETHICVGFPQKPISACYGDSGGPLVCRNEHFHWTLTGVTSFGTLCKGISVYTRVSHFRDWIDLQISQNPIP